MVKSLLSFQLLLLPLLLFYIPQPRQLSRTSLLVLVQCAKVMHIIPRIINYFQLLKSWFKVRVQMLTVILRVLWNRTKVIRVRSQRLGTTPPPAPAAYRHPGCLTKPLFGPIILIEHWALTHWWFPEIDRTWHFKRHPELYYQPRLDLREIKLMIILSLFYL